MIERILDRLGIEYELRGNEAWALCPLHEQRTGKPDHKPSWSINTDTGKHHCFSCGYRGGVSTLAADVRGIPLEEASSWVSQDRDPSFLKKTLQRVNQSRLKIRAPKVDEALFLSWDTPPEEQLQQRGITAEAAEHFDLRYKDGWVLPIRDSLGDLRGWQTKNGKMVRNHPPGMKKGLYLFGQYESSSSHPIVVVESPLDAVLSYQHGHQAVALFGAAFSPEQVAALAFYPQVVLALDNDTVGQEAQKRLSEFLTRRTVVRHVRWPSTMKDFGDNPEEIPHLITNAPHALWEHLRKTQCPK